MPRTSNYSVGKISKLVSDHTDDMCIGSTCQRLLSKRLVGHTWSYNTWLHDGCCGCSTSFENFKYPDCKIVLLENFPCKTKAELEARERFFIESMKCVNKVIPTRSHDEYHETHKEHLTLKQKQYYENHKEELSEWQRQYRHENKDKLKEQRRMYYESNKDMLVTKKRICRETSRTNRRVQEAILRAK